MKLILQFNESPMINFILSPRDPEGLYQIILSVESMVGVIRFYNGMKLQMCYENFKYFKNTIRIMTRLTHSNFHAFILNVY